MNMEFWSDVIGNISDKYIEEAAAPVLVHALPKYDWWKHVKRAACLCLCMVVILTAISSRDMGATGDPVLPNGELIIGPGGDGEQQNTTTTTTVYSGIGAPIVNTPVVFEGVEFSPEEKERYINESIDLILADVIYAYSGTVETVAVYLPGVYRLRCYSSNALDHDWLMMPLLVNGELIGVVHLCRDGDEVAVLTSIGGDKWENTRDILLTNPDSEIVFVAMQEDVLLFADGSVINPRTGEQGVAYSGKYPDTDWYGLLSNEYSTLSWSRIESSPADILTIYGEQ